MGFLAVVDAEGTRADVVVDGRPVVVTVVVFGGGGGRVVAGVFVVDAIEVFRVEGVVGC